MSWEDLKLGRRGCEDVDVRHSDGWWLETYAMVDRGYRRFFRKRGMEPPVVSRDEILNYLDDDR
jgi:hypothetical protein